MTSSVPRRDLTAAVMTGTQLAITSVLFWRFGVGVDKDLFDAGSALPWLIMVVLTGPHVMSAMSSVVGVTEGVDDAWEARRVFSSSLRGVTSLHALVTAMGVAGSSWIAAGLFPSLADPDRLAGLLRIGLGSHFLYGVAIATSTGGADTERRRLAWSAPLGQLGGVVVAAIALGASARVEDLAWGGLAGSAMAMVVVAWRVDRAGLGFDWTSPWMHRSLRTFVDSTVPALGLATLLSLESMLPAIGGQFAGEGAIAVLTGVRWLVVTAVTLSALPIQRPDGPADLPDDRNRWLRAAIVAETSHALVRASLALGLLIGLSLPIVATMFGHGLFDGAAVSTAALLAVPMSLALPFMAAAKVIHQSGDRAAGVSRAILAPLTIVAAAAVPGVIWAARTVGSTGVAVTWMAVVSIMGAGITGSWYRQAPRAEVEHLSHRLIVAAAGGGGAAAVGLAASWIGSRLDAPHPAVAIVGSTAAIAAFLVIVRRSGVDPELTTPRPRGRR